VLFRSDWGKRLGCGGHLETLRRLQSGRFAIEQALLLGQVEAAVRKGVLERVLISPHKALDWPGAVIDGPAARRVAEGQPLAGAELQGLPLARLKVGQRLTLSTPEGRLVALAELALDEHGPGLTARPLRVLQA
jgi:tRNA pseudouridine55 synthase